MFILERRSHQQSTGGKFIGTRWIDVNKSDSANPEYRSRLVGQEFRQGVDESLYAATPPPEGLRAVISHAATLDDWTPDGSGGSPREYKHVMINDVK